MTAPRRPPADIASRANSDRDVFLRLTGNDLVDRRLAMFVTVACALLAFARARACESRTSEWWCCLHACGLVRIARSSHTFDEGRVDQTSGQVGGERERHAKRSTKKLACNTGLACRLLVVSGAILDDTCDLLGITVGQMKGSPTRGSGHSRPLHCAKICASSLLPLWSRRASRLPTWWTRRPR